ncbi:Crp/Fnr family transcriptional regulator [Streptomyces sp. S465]|uniref:Crp/Fnr family transcriptional regulator n=1 Tax=Streptomyces sp. S465 TaxID=2979468 RepID=UPI0022A86C3E|nr:Crp/Fnr family transcriptional regulator [Streptomyces sp. S465]WAP55059.1 Crp/Fnr family transcriptional regulator [Streptomyces sp. S465]
MTLEGTASNYQCDPERAGSRPPLPGGWPIRSFLGRLQENIRADILQLGTRRHFSPEEILLQEGDRSQYVILLHSGFVKVTAQMENGREALLAIRAGGDIVGEMAALDDAPRSATVTACGEISANVVECEDLQLFLHCHSDAAITLTGMVVEKLRWANRRRVEYGGLPVKARLARVLSELAASHGHPVRRSLVIGVALSQPELAALTGSSEVTVHKALRELRQERLLATGYRRITVLDLPGLRRTAGLPDPPSRHP